VKNYLQRKLKVNTQLLPFLNSNPPPYWIWPALVRVDWQMSSVLPREASFYSAPSCLKGCKWGYLGFDRKRLEPREFPWQRHYGYYLISFVMNISGVRFEEHCFYISWDIFYSVFSHLSCKPDDVITYLICIIQKTSISLKWKKIFQKGKCFEKGFK